MPASAKHHRYRASVAARTFDVTLQDGDLALDGAPVTVTAEEIAPGRYALLVDHRSYTATITPLGDGSVRVTVGGRHFDVAVKDEKALLLERFGLASTEPAAARETHAPMPGLVVTVLVEPGQAVKAGDGLVVLEAMKMENELRAAVDGIVQAVHVAPGDAVTKNALLIELEG